jgi:hypothetical protein
VIRVLIFVCLFAAPGLAQTSAAHDILPEKEPSLADQARVAKEKSEPAEKAKIVLDNDTLERKPRQPIPDLGSPDLEVNTVVDKIVEYKNTHSADDAKQVINGWFLDQKSRIDKLNQQEKLYFEFQNRSSALGADWEVRNHASTADNFRSAADNRALDDLWKLRDRLRGQYGKVHDRALNRGAPQAWIPKEPGEE